MEVSLKLLLLNSALSLISWHFLFFFLLSLRFLLWPCVLNSVCWSDYSGGYFLYWGCYASNCLYCDVCYFVYCYLNYPVGNITRITVFRITHVVISVTSFTVFVFVFCVLECSRKFLFLWITQLVIIYRNYCVSNYSDGNVCYFIYCVCYFVFCVL